jgi:hypothetical protein
MSQNNNYNNNIIDSPPRHHDTVVTIHKRHAVTSNLGNNTIRNINISKAIADYFIRRSRENLFIADEMRKALQEAEK